MKRLNVRFGINALRYEHNNRYLTEDTFKRMFLEDNICVLKYVLLEYASRRR